MAISREIPIEYTPVLHAVAAEERQPLPPLTLSELIEAVDEFSDSEAEVIATVRYMMDSGRIKLMSASPDALARLGLNAASGLRLD